MTSEQAKTITPQAYSIKAYARIGASIHGGAIFDWVIGPMQSIREWTSRLGCTYRFFKVEYQGRMVEVRESEVCDSWQTN